MISGKYRSPAYRCAHAGYLLPHRASPHFCSCAFSTSANGCSAFVHVVQPLLPFGAGHEGDDGDVAGRGLEVFRVARSSAMAASSFLATRPVIAFGAAKPRSAVIVTGTPCSSAVGTSGRAGERCFDRMAIRAERALVAAVQFGEFADADQADLQMAAQKIGPLHGRAAVGDFVGLHLGRACQHADRQMAVGARAIMAERHRARLGCAAPPARRQASRTCCRGGPRSRSGRRPRARSGGFRPCCTGSFASAG